jgi:hypothetical protein
MQLTIHGIRASSEQPTTTLHVDGDTLTIDDVPHDLSAVPDGGEGWPDGPSHFIGPIRRIDGMIHATLHVMLGDDAHPEQDYPWDVAADDGPVAIPFRRAEVAPVEALHPQTEDGADEFVVQGSDDGEIWHDLFVESPE